MRIGTNVAGMPAAGPYSHAAEIDGLVYVSGQTPFDPATGRLIEGDSTVQAEQCFANLHRVLAECDLGADDVIKCNVYLTDLADFSAMNAVYARQFSAPYPARTTIQVAGLPLGASVEIEMIARRR